MNMTNLESVAVLRRMIECKQSPFKKSAGIYRWWFKESAARHLLSQLQPPSVNTNNIAKREIDGECYWALYFGISSNMRGRAAWHIRQTHTLAAVGRGFLSTLRQTLSALLRKEMSRSRCVIDKYMDDNCYLEWGYTDGLDKAREEEKVRLSTSPYAEIYPLNIQDNHTVSNECIERLKELRKEFKK